MNFHPYSEIFPLIEGTDFDALVADIKAHGLREKIWLYEGKILDGRNRFLACKKAKVKPLTRNYTGKDAGAFVWSMNVPRRHLSASQLAMAVARRSTLEKGTNQHAQNCAPSQSKVADEAKISRRSVQHARKVIDEGSKDLQRAVDSGEVSVSKAASVVDLPKPRQLKAATQKPEPTKSVEVIPAPNFDFADYEPEDDDAYKQNVENVMMADDKLAAMREELKQLHREMQGLKASRDHYQSESGAAVRLVKARDREIEKLKKELTKAQDENEALRERVSIMEAA